MNQKGSPRFAVEAGLAPILIIIILAGILLFIPLPRYQKAMDAELYPPHCTQAVWKLWPSIWDGIANQTTSWKTYTNTKYGFSIKHPPNLEPRIVDYYDIGRGYGVVLEDACEVKHDDGYIIMYVFATNDLIKSDYFRSEIFRTLPRMGIGESFSFGKRTPNILIDNIEAYAFENYAPRGAPTGSFTKEIYLTKDDNTFITNIYIVHITDRWREELVFFEKILSTFKFLP